MILNHTVECDVRKHIVSIRPLLEQHREIITTLSGWTLPNRPQAKVYKSTRIEN